ncbi:putative ubiquitin-conjugating enzyme E2 38 [Sesamum indicum]|uniref:Ubiquitin-conjugating enzyme E2 38 n=1 Tax=Sesamum indicum TaxID=4182 RepID=A0A6I9TBU8_SESIN|nr:putative ubiquitin-conjugating enzyme E2 38 [Sesamum indicum]
MDQHLPSASNIERRKTNSEDLEIKKIFGEIEEIEDAVERSFNRFRNFDIISHPPRDHHYLSYRPHGLEKTVCGSNFSRRIEQEWSLLAENIPNSIFVRAYQHRIDLLRAAIIGPPGTPYHHCLFFFDICFPRNYPSTPPKLHYRSYNLDLNPSLWRDGRVCLTPCETWFDRLKQNWLGNNNKGKWNPNESNLLQVLRGIQDLISSSSPHSLEHSRFMSTCEKMIRILRQPPQDFEDFVAGHFRKRAHPVLLKFKENNYDSKLMIDLFVSLFKAFETNGAYCKHHLDFLRPRNQQNQ